jgi:hypothetical protein
MAEMYEVDSPTKFVSSKASDFCSGGDQFESLSGHHD